MNITNIPNKITVFLKEVKTEMRKVNWPTKDTTIRYTLIILGASALVALYLGGLDIFFMELLEKFII